MMRFGVTITLCGLGLALGVSSVSHAQVTAAGEAFSTRVLLLNETPLLETGDTTTNGVDAGEDFATESGGPAMFTDTVPGSIIDQSPVIEVNGGD
jgi:hypothetical protein